jgi:uncharacterized membrane protein YedE/YeeE
METLEKSVVNTDFETRSLDAGGAATIRSESPLGKLKYTLAGIGFGIVLIKAEVISWFRIQEMFRFESFHMYGVIGSAVVVGIISVFLIKRSKAKAITGEPITLAPKAFNQGLIFGGVLFGMGWAITGACPGPLYAQIGAGFPVIIVTLLSAMAGTWCYGLLREKLPH